MFTHLSNDKCLFSGIHGDEILHRDNGRFRSILTNNGIQISPNDIVWFKVNHTDYHNDEVHHTVRIEKIQ